MRRLLFRPRRWRNLVVCYVMSSGMTTGIRSLFSKYLLYLKASRNSRLTGVASAWYSAVMIYFVKLPTLLTLTKKNKKKPARTVLRPLGTFIPRYAHVHAWWGHKVDPSIISLAIRSIAAAAVNRHLIGRIVSGSVTLQCPALSLVDH